MRLRSRFAVQLGGQVLGTLAFLVLTPFLVSQLGLDRYGTLLIVLGFTVYIGNVDLGVGAATSREIAAHDDADRPAIFGTSLLINGACALIGGALFSVLALRPVAALLIRSPAAVEGLTSSGPALFALGVFTVAAGVPTGALHGTSSFLRLNVASLLGVAGSVVAPGAYAAFFGKDLPGLIAAVAVAQGLTVATALVLCAHAGLRPTIRFDRAAARRLLAYGGWLSVSGLLHRATNSLDRPLLGALSGPAMASIFAIPQSALGKTQMLGSALLSAAFPRLARDPGDTGLIDTCYRAVLLLSPAFVVGIALLEPLIRLWLGHAFAVAALPTAVALSIYAWFELLTIVPYTLLMARSQMRREAAIAACIAVPNLALLWWAVTTYGPFGAAIVAVFRSGTYLVCRIAATSVDARLARKVVAHSLLVTFATLTYCLSANQEFTRLLLCAGMGVAAAVLNYVDSRHTIRSLIPWPKARAW